MNKDCYYYYYYYPPGQAAINEITMIDYLINGIDFILQSYPSAGIIIAGDFNKMKLGTLCNCFDLRKIVKKPTRQNNTLDQIMTLYVNNEFECFIRGSKHEKTV